MEITVVIPCRAGSTRVKNKNFRPFGDSNLLEIKVNQAKSLGLPIVIDSDSDIAKEVALKNQILFHERPAYYASSKCNNSEYYEYLGNSVNTEYIMILQPTAPLLKDITLKEAYQEFKNKINQYDSLVTAEFAKKHAWYKGAPINYDLANTPNSQDLDPIILPTFNVMIAKVSNLVKTRNIITDRCLFYKISESESIEIDNQLEFDIAEFMYKKMKNENK